MQRRKGKRMKSNSPQRHKGHEDGCFYRRLRRELSRTLTKATKGYGSRVTRHATPCSDPGSLSLTSWLCLGNGGIKQNGRETKFPWLPPSLFLGTPMASWWGARSCLACLSLCCNPA